MAQTAKNTHDDAVSLDQVIVTGTRTPVAIEKVPGAVTLVTPEQVQRTLNLTEDATAVLARMVPGYSESSQAMSNSGETLRGRVALRLDDLDMPHGEHDLLAREIGAFGKRGQHHGLQRAQHAVEAIVDRGVHWLSSIMRSRASSSTNNGPVAARKVSSTSWWLCAWRAARTPSAATRM